MKAFLVQVTFYLVLSATSALGADSEPVMKTKITGNDETYTADVELISGKRRILTDSVVTVEEVFGQDPQGTSWFYFGDTLEDADGIGAADDTVRVQIPAGASPLNAIYPAVDYTYTITAADVAADNPERHVALNFCAGINADSDFVDAMWKCVVARDFALVHIESKLFNEFGTRDSWTLTCSGTTTCAQGYADIKRRGKPTELSRSPNDPRQGVLAIAGTVTTLPGGIGDAYQEFFKNSLSASEMKLDCDPYVSGTCDFRIEALTDKRLYVEAIKCFGGANGIKFGQFLAKNVPLTNGILISIQSEEETFTFIPIHTTEDFKNILATSPGADFRIDIQAGADQFIAQFRPSQPIPIDPQGSYTTDDYILVKIRDDISAGLTTLECIAQGFEREP